MERHMRKRITRRRLLKIVWALPFVGSLLPGVSASAQDKFKRTRVRPGDPGWPAEEKWAELDREVGGRLIKVRSPLSACVGVPPIRPARKSSRSSRIPIISATKSG